MSFRFTNSLLFLSVAFLFMLSCTKEKKKSIRKQAEELVLDEPVYEPEETDEADKLFVIEDKAVIFFLLSNSEMKKLYRELGGSYRFETDYLFNNFNQQAKAFRKALAKHNIHSKIAYNKRFLIKLKNGQTVRFNRIREDQIMGEIITDGVQDPLIEYGMYTKKDLVNLIKKYYKIENFGFVENPPDLPLQLPDEKMNLDSATQVVY
jgi:hypothetical protein